MQAAIVSVVSFAILVFTMNGDARAQCSLQWQSGGGGTNGQVNAIACLPNGDLVAGGAFTMAASTNANFVARWNGATWSPLAAGLSGSVYSLLPLDNGELIAGGSFGNGLARWTGSAWVPMGPSGGYIRARALARMPNGDVISVGQSNLMGLEGDPGVFRNGGLIGRLNTTAVEFALAVLPNGNLVVGGQISTITVNPWESGVSCNGVAQWDGTTWSSLGAPWSGSVHVFALHVLPNGHLVAGGSDGKASRWDGTNWIPYPYSLGSVVRSLTSLPDGDLVAGASQGIYRWNGSSWVTLSTANTFALNFGPSGDLAAGGNFTVVSGAPSNYFTYLESTCPGVAQSTGNGCASSGGGNVLSATTLPWVDAEFRAKATGLPSNSIVLALTSLTSVPQGAAPLASVFPQAGVGCDVLVAPDILQAFVAVAGAAESSLFLSNTPPLVGVTFFHQMLPIEFDALGNWVAFTATNALQLTAGVF